MYVLGSQNKSKLRENLAIRASADVGAKEICKIKYILWCW